jgi:hypothetical protein
MLDEGVHRNLQCGQIPGSLPYECLLGFSLLLKSAGYQDEALASWPQVGNLLVGKTVTGEHMQSKLVVLGFAPKPALNEFVAQDFALHLIDLITP